jgi:chromosome segregation ATPase
MPREVTNDDLKIIDEAIASHESVQHQLYVLRRVLGEIGKLDFAAIKSNVKAHQDRLDEVRKQADAAQAYVDELQKQMADKRRELADVETTIKERTIAANNLNESYNNLRNMLAAA